MDEKYVTSKYTLINYSVINFRFFELFLTLGYAWG
jgi:hypothetical protein